MSLLKSITNKLDRLKQIKENKAIDKEYVNSDLLDWEKNSYYYRVCEQYNVILKNPQNTVSGDLRSFDNYNFPIYTISFSSSGKAQQFVDRNIIKENGQSGVEIALVDSKVVIKPISMDYRLHIRVNDSKQGADLVKMFRAQYVKNMNLQHKLNKFNEVGSSVLHNKSEDKNMKIGL